MRVSLAGHDFGSRQPFYVLLLAVLLKCFGSSLLVGRMLPLISSLAAGWMIFLIGKKLFDYQTGLIAMSIYLFLPLLLMPASPHYICRWPLCFFCRSKNRNRFWNECA